MHTVGYALFFIVPLALVIALGLAFAAGCFVIKRRITGAKKRLLAIAAMGVSVAYGVYFISSMAFSALDTGYGHTVGEENLAALEQGLDLPQVFAAEGAELERVCHGWAAKQCWLWFRVKKGSPVTIPPALDSYIAAHPELGSGNRLSIRICQDAPGCEEDTPSTEKTYFWWRMLY